MSEPVNFADHRVARDAAEASGDLAGAQAFAPELFQQLHALIRPSHKVSLPEPQGRAQSEAHTDCQSGQTGDATAQCETHYGERDKPMPGRLRDAVTGMTRTD